MTKYEISDDHEWADEQEPEQPEQQAVTITKHVIRVQDERDVIEDYNGLEWSFVVEQGTITAVGLGHYCPGPAHIDPMGFRSWADVPGPVQHAVLEGLNGTEDEIVDVDATEEVVEGDWR